MLTSPLVDSGLPGTIGLRLFALQAGGRGFDSHRLHRVISRLASCTLQHATHRRRCVEMADRSRPKYHDRVERASARSSSPLCHTRIRGEQSCRCSCQLQQRRPPAAPRRCQHPLLADDGAACRRGANRTQALGHDADRRGDDGRPRDRCRCSTLVEVEGAQSWSPCATSRRHGDPAPCGPGPGVRGRADRTVGRLRRSSRASGGPPRALELERSGFRSCDVGARCRRGCDRVVCAPQLIGRGVPEPLTRSATVHLTGRLVDDCGVEWNSSCRQANSSSSWRREPLDDSLAPSTLHVAWRSFSRDEVG